MATPFPSIRDLAQKNAGATSDFKPKLTLQNLMAREAVVVISCVDPRADPKDFWGIQPGMPPGIVRNAGGRAECGVGPHGIDDMYIRETLPGRMKGSEQELVDKEWYPFKHQTEEESVKEDMRLIMEDKLLPKDVQVLGFVLDVETNKTTEVLL
ncbi:uncharacterized protein N0V89_010477 [Didymosphaeria variabile]|uniref:Carbonic anhydrase n=1 Tax=Didymosphaeria variabile TaxID=1932322 RepID=A0A9W8XDD2_9PLEO|nr:uncharacterized protein N0V89_010477 [Didymosphaeria variabile]KAJ4346546.1 hypothetical protein N0V89_010477 [Didymosphaeria variabile]